MDRIITPWWDWKVVTFLRTDVDQFGNEMVTAEVRHRYWHPGYWFNRLLWRVGWHRIIEAS